MPATRVHTGIGCLAVIPAAVIGFAGLADGAGPTGWRGFAELIGWFVACMVAAVFLALLLARCSRTGAASYALALAAVAGAGILAYAVLNWLGLGAPMAARILFTSSMQALGAIATFVCALVVVRELWRAGR